MGFNVAHIAEFGWVFSGFPHRRAKMPNISLNADACRRAFGSEAAAG